MAGMVEDVKGDDNDMEILGAKGWIEFEYIFSISTTFDVYNFIPKF